MRHPISRTISHYHHLMNVDRGNVGNKIRKSKDINDFFDRMQHWEFDNFMTRVVSGNGRDGEMAPDEMLETAKHNLTEHFDFVGFQEFFTLSALKLSDLLGTSFAFEKDVNIGRYDLSEISQPTIDTISEINQLDLELYKFAIGRFL